MKKLLVLVLVALLCVFSLAGCGGTLGKENQAGRIRVVVTAFPLYDWTRNIIGADARNVELTLLGGGVDMHSYQPTPQDIMKLGSADLLIYVGGESDEWVGEALKEAGNKKMVTLNLMEALGERAKHEELAEGMTAEPERKKEGHGAAEPEKDEHIWLSLKNAQVLCRAIADSLSEVDAAQAGIYGENAKAYLEKLSALDDKYRQAVAGAGNRTLLFGDRFPFRYLVDDYGLRYYAAFPGCSAETEASFETVAFLSGKMAELKLPAVLTIEGRTHRLAETIVENSRTGAKILVLDSMQSVPEKDVAGASYLGAMEKNLEVFEEALQ